MKYKSVKGCYDVAPGTSEPFKRIEYWYWIEKRLVELAMRYGFEEMRLPSFESSELFIRTSGTSSDIVSKEMYTFKDKADRSITLRPEWTAPIVRSFIENGLHTTHSQKLFYLGPCWRYDRQQKGRYREFKQFGIEVFGIQDPLIDVEVIALADAILKSLNLTKTEIVINNIGDASTRGAYSQALINYLQPYISELSKESQSRIVSNPLRILDSKDEGDIKICQSAPSIEQFLSKPSKYHFDMVLKALDDLNIKYSVDSNLIRGLDYYCHTVFEINRANDQGRQNSLGGGGRFDHLMKSLSGPDLPGIGFALGLERIIQTLVEEENFHLNPSVVSTLIAPLCDSCKMQALKIVMQLREAGISSELYYQSAKIKKVLSYADKLNIQFVLLFGPDEREKSSVLLKDMKSQEQKSIPLNEIAQTMKTVLLGAT
jgi:histidyl-tRNA synthetase